MNKFTDKDDDLKCAPSKRFDSDARTCFSIQQLQSIAHSYNKTTSNKIIVTNDKKDLLRKLISKLDKACNDQVCLLQESFVRNVDDFDMLYNTFRPQGPSYKFQWLSTSDINQVMIQYMEAYKDFIFFGALPIDFKEIKVPISFDNFFKTLSNMYKDGKRRIGYVFNMDRHDQSGSHWMGLFADLGKNQVYFFDSAEDHSSHKPKKQIIGLMKTIAIWCYFHNIKKQEPNSELCSLEFFGNSKNVVEKVIDVQYNKVQHQRGNSECGVYSINFIVRLLKGDSFNTIIDKPIDDKTINDFRKIIFRFK